MEETTSRLPSGEEPPRSASALPPPAPWRPVRTRQKVLGGVCGGLAVATGVDVTLVRLAFIAAGFAGVGVIAYGVLWVVLPREDPAAGRPAMPAPDDTGRWLRVALLVGAIVGLSTLLGGWPLGWGGPDTDGGFLIGIALLAVGAAYLWSRRRREERRPLAVAPVGPAHSTTLAHTTWAPPSPPAPAGQPFPGSGPVTPTGLPPVTPGAPGGPLPPATGGTFPPRKPPASAGLIAARVIGWLAVLVALPFAAFLAVVVGGEAVSMYLPGLVGVVGLAAWALLIGTTVGAKRAWPILVSVALLIGAAGFAVAMTRWDGGVGERINVPTTAEQVRPSYELAVGRRVLDLTSVDLPEGTTSVTIDHRIGQVEVIVPADATVTATVHIGAGEAQVFGQTNDGFDVDLVRTDTPTVSSGSLDLDVDMGIGQVRVCRPGPDTGGDQGCGSQGQ